MRNFWSKAWCLPVTLSVIGLGLIGGVDTVGAQQSRWQVRPEPEVTLGAVEGEAHELFSDIRDVTVLSDGSVAIADGGSQEIRIFSESGQYLRSLGRAGEGPGEFAGGLAWLREISDGRLVAFDRRNLRMTFFDLVDGSVSSETLERPAESRLTPNTEPMLDNGGVLLYFVSQAPRVSGETGVQTWQDSVIYLWYDDAGGDGSVIGRGLGDEGYAVRVENRGVLGELPLGTRQLVATGRRVAAWGNSESTSLHIVDEEGNVNKVTLAMPRTVLTADMWRKHRDIHVSNSRESAREAIELLFERIEKPLTLPLIGEILIDDTDRLWASTAEVGEERRSWFVWTSNGRLLGRAELPEDAEIVEIAQGHVYGVTVDSLGVERVVKWRLERR